MWIEQHKAYLSVRCEKCGEDLEGELSTSQGFREQTILVVTECECTRELEQKITELEEQIEETNNAEEHEQTDSSTIF